MLKGIVLSSVLLLSSGIASAYSIQVVETGDTLLKKNPAFSYNNEYNTEICTLPAGTLLNLAGEAVSEGVHVKLKLASNSAAELAANGCEFTGSTAYIYGKHTENYRAAPYSNYMRLSPRGIQNTINGILRQSFDSNTKATVELRIVAPNDKKFLLHTFNDWLAVRPASNMKILTAWAMLYTNEASSVPGTPEFNNLRFMMKLSNNGIAQQMYDDVGGASRIQSLMTSAGIPPSANTRLIDGSGLSYSNQLSGHNLVQVLDQLRVSNKLDVFRQLLPIGGEDGTLASRLSSVPCQVTAKTGTSSKIQRRPYPATWIADREENGRFSSPFLSIVQQL